MLHNDNMMRAHELATRGAPIYSIQRQRAATTANCSSPPIHIRLIYIHRAIRCSHIYLQNAKLQAPQNLSTEEPSLRRARIGLPHYLPTPYPEYARTLYTLLYLSLHCCTPSYVHAHPCAMLWPQATTFIQVTNATGPLHDFTVPCAIGSGRQPLLLPRSASADSGLA